MASILVVEDSLDTIELLQVALSGYDLTFKNSLEDARDLIAGGLDFDLILLDLNLPDGDGLTLGAQLSTDGQTPIPIIVLSARSDVRDKVRAFAFGAEDYVQKPFDVLELQARVSARLRKAQVGHGHEKRLETGSLRIDSENMRAFVQLEGRWAEVDLSVTEHRILKTLLEKPRHVHTRSHLMREIWGDRVVGSRTIDSHVSNLRAKIGAAGVQIESIRGLGYRLQFRD